MTKPLEAYPRVVVIEALDHDATIAWLRPFALIEDRYIHKLPEEICTEFGVDFDMLLAKKGLTAQLSIGDAFRTYSPYQPGPAEVIGDYVPQVDTL